MARCDSYYQHGMKFVCYGTKNMEECSCGGDTSKCNFYPEKRNQKARTKYRVVTFRCYTDLESFLNRVAPKNIISISESCCVFGGIQRNYTLVYKAED